LLLTHDEVYVEANRVALQRVYGLTPEGPDMPGDTAPAHTRRALRAAGLSADEIDAGLPAWCATFSAVYRERLARADTSHWEIGPGAAEAISAVERPALLTGNPAAVAHARLERLGLARFFPPGQGAYGCEREDRAELFALARERAGDWPAKRTVAVGDTPLDVSSAHAAGCLCIGVTTGQYSSEALAAADAVIGSLNELGGVLAGLR
jgi:phosphoglycolate phosphatase-like HAD superfamily hydrolase